MKNIFSILLTCTALASLSSLAHAKDTKPFSDAGFVFAIQDISIDGNVIHFTIPKDARKIDALCNTVELSGLYTTAEKPSKNCPVVSSYDVKKEIKSYNMMSGKADIKAVFDKQDDAKAAFKAECLLIEDKD